MRNLYSHFLILNVASGKSISLRKIINILSDKYKVEKKNIVYNKSKPSMIPVRKINIQKLKVIINFSLKFSIKKGLIKTIEWYKKNKY